MKQRIIGLVATLAALCGTTLIATPAAAATPTCNTVKSVAGYNGFFMRVPAYSSTGSTTCALAEGNYNASVLELQKALNKCFYGAYKSTQKYWPLKEDSDFGPNTKKALTEAQDHFTDNPADIDGVYGPITRNMLLWRLSSGDGCWFF